MKKTTIITLVILFLFILGTSLALAQTSGYITLLPVVSKDTAIEPAAYTQDGGSVSETHKTYVATEDDQSAVYVTNSGEFTLDYATITKSGDSSSNDNSSFYGLNAAVLAEAGSSIDLSNATITSTGSGANGAFSTGSGSVVNLTDITILAEGGGAHGVMATQQGVMTLINVDITTTGANSAPIATDRGSGTITVSGGESLTSGNDSPCLYSTGLLTISDYACTATASEMAVIEGANSIDLTNSTLTSSAEDKWGVMIYQSMSGDADGTLGVFTMTGGLLDFTAASGALFFNTNSTAIITLNGVDVSAASGILVEAAGTDRWGTVGENGGITQLTANGQTLVGDMVVDAISSIDVTLQNASSLTGALNTANTGTLSLTLDASSTWTVTADSYLTSLCDADGISGTTVTNIIGNGYTVYYVASACPELGGLTYTLSGGGTLQPTE